MRAARRSLTIALRSIAILALVLFAAACVSPSTAVLCTISTDLAPADPIEIHATVRLGPLDGGIAMSDVSWSNADGGLPYNISFGIRPSPGQRHDAAFNVVVEAVSNGIHLRRIVRTRFVPSTTSTLRVFLTRRCADPAATDECTAAGIGPSCSLQSLCEARGATCDETGRCVMVEIPVTTTDAAPACGTPGQPCCDGVCRVGAVCSSSLCVPCGERGYPCCGGNVCTANLACASGTCR